MIKSLTVSNFRAFHTPACLEIEKLTLLYGRNNVGKSSLVRLLPLLRDSMKPTARAPIDLSSPAARAATFEDISTRPPLGGKLAITLDLIVKLNGGELGRFGFEVRDYPEERRQYVQWIRAELAPDLEFFGEWDLERSPAFGSSLNFIPEPPDAPLALRFQGPLPQLSEGATALQIAWKRLTEAVQQSCSAINWLGATRVSPNRTVKIWTDTPELINELGSGAQQNLVADWQNGREVFDRVSLFFKERMQQQLVVLPEGREYGVYLGPIKNPNLLVNLVDCGEGIAQVFPVLVALESARFSQPHGAVLAIEQPELHLHTDAQIALAEYLCDSAGDASVPALVIETHSESFLLSVQLAILEKRLKPENVALYWVDQFEDGRSVLQRAPIGVDGHAEGWPVEAFRSRLDHARQVLRARQEQKRGL